MPQALRCGISYKEFWHLTPAAIVLIEKAYQDNMKMMQDLIEQHAWLAGQYVCAAIGASFSKKVKYPENPLVEREKNRTDFTEEEKMKYVNAFFGQLGSMQKSFEMNHKSKEK